MRLFLPEFDMLKQENIKALKEVIERLEKEGSEVHVWISIPRSPWCTWQGVNLRVIEKFKEVLTGKRQKIAEAT